MLIRSNLRIKLVSQKWILPPSKSSSWEFWSRVREGKKCVCFSSVDDFNEEGLYLL
jgi:hypothetical protein